MPSFSCWMIHHYPVFNRGVTRHQLSLKIWLFHFMNCLCNQSQHHVRMSSRGFRAKTSSTPTRFWRNSRSITSKNCEWTFHYAGSLPCQLLGMLLKLMCSKWNRLSKWVTGKGRRFYLFLPQTSKVKRLLSFLLSHHVGLSWRKKTTNLKTSYKET
jgi:hypothetical protein